MGIQIFGVAKSFDTKKAERWFSERRIPFQAVDLKEKGISPGELDSVIVCLAKTEGGREGAIEALIDKKNKEYASIAYLGEEDKAQKLLDNPLLLNMPVVRNGKNNASVGFKPDLWKDWN